MGLDLMDVLAVAGFEGACTAGAPCVFACAPLLCEEYPESLAPSRGGAARYLSNDLGGLELVVALRRASLRVSGFAQLWSLS